MKKTDAGSPVIGQWGDHAFVLILNLTKKWCVSEQHLIQEIKAGRLSAELQPDPTMVCVTKVYLADAFDYENKYLVKREPGEMWTVCELPKT